MVRDFQSVIGQEIKLQMAKLRNELPNSIVACVGGGSNAIGTFYPFVNDSEVSLYGVEAGGQGLHTKKHSASLSAGSEGILHGMFTYVLQDRYGQVLNTHSISAGLDYPAVGPEHAYLKESKRAKYVECNDDNAINAFLLLCKLEGIIPALEPSHALSQAMKIAGKMDRDESVVVTLSGRGDKDVEVVSEYLQAHKLKDRTKYGKSKKP
jgi:tryptophan synthase beta chain